MRIAERSRPRSFSLGGTLAICMGPTACFCGGRSEKRAFGRPRGISHRSAAAYKTGKGESERKPALESGGGREFGDPPPSLFPSAGGRVPTLRSAQERKREEGPLALGEGE